MVRLHFRGRSCGDWRVFVLAGVVLVYALMSVGARLKTGKSFLEIYSYLDSGWYALIAESAYNKTSPGQFDGVQYAFFPLWPLIVGTLTAILGAQPVILGVFSAGILAVGLFLFLTFWRTSSHPLLKLSQSPYPFLFLLLVPGGWVFYSNHTESLFLILSYSAFYFAYSRRPIPAGVLAGLCSLTRNQGIIVAVTTGLIAYTVGDSSRDKISAFLKVGFLSFALFLTWPIYQYLLRGNPFMWIDMQKHWTIVNTWFDYFDNMLWLSSSLFLRKLTFWASIAVGIKTLFAKDRLYRPLGFYILTSSALLPLQGYNLPQTFRFTSVVFPFWFLLGNYFEKIRILRDVKMRLILCLALFCLSLQLSYNHAFQTEWPY